VEALPAAPARRAPSGVAGLPARGDDGRSASAKSTWTPRQHQILDDLEALFLSEGFRHLTIADLVDRLRCSRRTLYSLAPSREELILVVIGRLLNRMGVEAFTQAAALADPGEAVASYLNTGVTTLSTAQPAFIEDLETYLPTRQLYDRHVEIGLRVMGTFISDGIAAGTFRELHPALVAEIISGAAERILRPDALARTGMSWSQALAELSELIRYGLLSPGPRTERAACDTRRPERRRP
jgi:AcrR family transcriptional regulator